MNKRVGKALVKSIGLESLEERFTHACTPKRRFACLSEATSAKAGRTGMAVAATGRLIQEKGLSPVPKKASKLSLHLFHFLFWNSFA